jgi:hypothetical protein
MKPLEHLRSWKLLCLTLLLVAPTFGCPEDGVGGEANGDDLAADGREPLAVYLEPGTAIVRSGDSVGFEAIAVYPDGTTGNITDAATWTCTEPSVVDVSNDEGSKGMASAADTGTSTLRANTPWGIRAEAPIEVVASREQIEDDVRMSLPVELFPSIPTDMPLYAESANEVVFQATNMGDSYTVELENVEGGMAESAEPANAFILAPSDAAMTFDAVVSNARRTERFDGLSYESTAVPAPEIQLFNTRRGREVEKGVDASDMTSLEVRIASDEDFRAAYPDDAAVRLADITVTLERASGTNIIRTYSSGAIDLYDFRTAADVGDRLYIEIDEVERQNYRGDVIPLYNYTPSSFYVPLK